MPIVQVSSLDDPQLDIFRSLKKTNRTRHQALFIAEGATVVERLIAAGFQLHSLLVTPELAGDFVGRVSNDVPVLVVARELATELVGYKFHLGVIAAAHRRPALQLGEMITADLGHGLVILADQVVDPENAGALIRIGSAFGAAAVVFGAGSVDPYSRRVIRVSTGHVFSQPILEVADSEAAIESLRALGYSSVATALRHDTADLRTFSFPSKSVIVLGNERHGLSPALQKHCDMCVTIPMYGNTDSLNLAVAAGIFAYQFRQQFP